MWTNTYVVMGPRCTCFIFLICVIDSIKGFSPRVVVNIRVLCCLFVAVCVYIIPGIYSAGYVELPIVLLYLLRSMLGVSHAVQNEKKL